MEQQLWAATGAQLAAVVANWATQTENAPDLSLVQWHFHFSRESKPWSPLDWGCSGIWDCGQEVSPRGTRGHCQLSNDDGTTDP